MRTKFFLILTTFFTVFLIFPSEVFASTESICGESFTQLLLSLTLVLFVAKVGGEIAVRLKQPEVLGELLGGILIGNLWWLGISSQDLVSSSAVKLLSELGVILLLFEVGLESSVKQMRSVGSSALLVAVLGVIAPFLLGWGVHVYFYPDASVLAHMFIGATLSATSVGITARVLKDLGRLQSSESQIILGAAVIDDVLGLLILAVITGMIQAASGGADLSNSAILMILLKAFGFLAAALILGPSFSVAVFRPLKTFKKKGAILTAGLILCFFFSALASVLGLAPIVGAFIAGLIIDPEHYHNPISPQLMGEAVRPITLLLVPVFFVLMGANVDLRAFTDTSILGFACALTLAAIVGKQVCGFGVLQRGLDRVLVGLGMIPRGEVGLIFASIGASLALAGEKIISSEVYAAVVLMVVITTMLTPLALNWRISKKGR